VERRGSSPPPSLRLDAQRLAAGRAIQPHPILMAHLVGKEFGIAPHEVMDWEAGDLLRTFMLMADLQPKEKYPRG